MKFEIKTCGYSGDRKPCQHAKKELVENWEFRNTKTEASYNTQLGSLFGKWLERGTNQEFIRKDGNIVGMKRRLEDREAWVVEITSIEELTEFCRTYSPVRIDTADETFNTPGLLVIELDHACSEYC